MTLDPTQGGTHKGPAPRPDLEAIEARANAATPPPWTPKNGKCGAWIDCDERISPEFVIGFNLKTGEPDDEDAEFIAAARQDIPALVAYALSLEAALREIAESHYAPSNPFMITARNALRATPEEKKAP